MKKRILPLLLALALTVGAIVGITVMTSAEETTAKNLPTAEQSGEVIDVWLVAGQSNAIGSAKVDNYPTDEAYADYKTMLTNGSDNVWHIRNTYTEFVPAGFKQGSGTQCGPELGIATALMNSTNKAAIVKVAYGNTALWENTTSTEAINYGTWTPPSYIEKHNINTAGNKTGDLYLTFIAKVALAVEELEAMGYTVNLKGVWWMQGEADTLTSTTTIARYEELLTTLISDMRSDLTKVSGYDCSELPFVYGRILSNHIGVGKDVPTGLDEVQTAQDNVANNKSLKNVFMVNTTTDLVDPVTGEHRLPVQQDSWHYDSLSQQMIGEKFVRIVNNVKGTFTKYGFLPKDTGSNPFAVFKKVDGAYVFDSYQDAFSTAINRAVALTHITSGTTGEAVILAVKDYGAGNYGTDVANSGGTITLDLNGHTLSPSVALFTTAFSDSTASNKTVFNLKNGTMLFQQFGAMFTTGSTSKSQSFDFNVENMSFGFISGTQNKTQEAFKFRDILVSDRNCTTSGGAKVTINLNVTNSNFDLVTNALSNATVGTFKECKTTDYGYTDYIVSFADCKFLLQKPENESDAKGKVATAIGGVVSSSGDVVKFIKGDGGAFGEIRFKETPAFDHIKALTFDGVDDGFDADIILRVKSGVYYLTTASDVETPYGTIPAEYSNSYAYAYAVFKKVDGAYVFDSVQSNVQTSFERATALTHVKTGVTDDVVIFVRESIEKDGSYPSNVSDIGGTVTLDLNGYTIRPTTTLLRTDWDDDGVVNGVQKTATVNVKNGSLEVAQFGLLFTTTGTTYTVPKTFNFNLENVKLGFYETTKNQTGSRKYMDLIVSDRSNSSTVNAYINVTATNCVFDLESNARDVALLATLDCGSNDKDTNDYNLKIAGGTIITDDIAKVDCHTMGTGDSFTFERNADGNYPVILMKQNLAEPDESVVRNGENGEQLSCYETGMRVGIYKVYELRDGLVTKYGVVPKEYAKSNFVVFVRNNGGKYEYNSAYSGWKSAFENTAVLTNGSESAYDEAVILMLRDTLEGGVPYNGAMISGTVNLDLNGRTLTLKGSFFNTWLEKSASQIANINVYDGTIRTMKFGLVYTAIKSSDTTYESEGKEKVFNVNFNNVVVGFEDYPAGTNKYLIANAYSGSKTLNTTVNMNFEGCTFDLVKNATSSAILGAGQTVGSGMTTATTVDFNVNINNSKFFVHAFSQVSITLSAEGDSFTNTNSTIVTNTAYGEVSLKDTSLDNVPYFVFQKKSGADAYTFVGGYDKWTNAVKAAVPYIEAAKGATAGDTALILLRKDFNIASDLYSDTYKVGGHLIVDLGGHTMTLGTSLMSIRSNDYETGKAATGYVTVNNGSLVNNSQYGIIYSRIEDTSTVQKTYYIDFNNVNFSYGTSATAKSLIVHAFEKTNRKVSSVINFTYNDCFFDLDTNVPAGSVLANYDTVGSNTDFLIFNAAFNGCVFEGTGAFSIPLGVGDTLTFGAGSNGKIATVKVANGTNAPTGLYPTANGNAKFVKTSVVDGDYILYTMIDESIATYAPKMSLTLDRNLIMNVYVPVNGTVKFTLDGKKYTDMAKLASDIVTLDDGKNYYRIELELPAAEAARDIKLAVNITVGTESANGSFTFSTVKYAAKVIASAGSTEVEKTLVKDVLAYVKAAYVYFDSIDTDAMSKIDTVLGSYTSAPTVEGSYSSSFVGLESVTLVLDETPSIRFYLADGADSDSYKFYINGKIVDTQVAADGSYVDIDVYAYALAETVSYTVNGAEGGSYHVRNYYEYVSGTGANSYNGTDKAELTALAASFWKYLQSARAYKNQ